jgi:hypothetical protein
MQNITTIKLHNNSLYPTDPTGGYLDTDDKTVIPLNFAIADIRDISKKKGVFSKSITVPGTKNNHKILNNYFDTNVKAGTFDINKLQLCSIIQNGVIVLDNALLQLVSINKTQQNGSYEENVTYTLLVKDQTSDFFTTLNNKMLDTLDFSDLNHIYTAYNVIQSFDNTIADGYKYIMPYNSPDLDGGVVADAVFDLIEFAPAIYAKKYWDKIFAGAGYSYVWNGMTSSNIRFDKLLIPYNGDVVTVDKEESEIFTATAGRTASTIHQSTTGFTTTAVFGGGQAKISIVNSATNQSDTDIIANIEVNDPNNNYNPTTGVYSAPNIPSTQNSIQVEYTVEYEVVVNNQAGTLAYFNGHYNQDYFNTPAAQYYSHLSTSYSREIMPMIRINRNGSMVFENYLSDTDRFYIPQKTSFPTGVTSLHSGTVSFTEIIDTISVGDQINLSTGLNYRLYNNGNYTGFGADSAFWNFYPTIFSVESIYTSSPLNTSRLSNCKIELRVKKVDVKYTCLINGDVSFNVPLKMNKFIPKQIKQSDFIKGILTMYNLFVEVDKEIPNRLNITTRDEYYDNGKVEDWTKKLVKDKPQELKFIPEITNKKTILTYKQDEDWANKRYKGATNEIYGQAEYIFDNEYVKDITTVELLFSPTPVANASFGAVLPIWNGQAPQTNIRILYDGGKWSCSPYNIINYYDTNTGATGTSNGANYYPLTTHWDRPTNPTFDLNFLPCDFYFRSDNWGSDTNNNLFNLHWRRTMNQINSGKLLTAYFNLTSYDIQKMRLSDKIRIDNSWWFINSIKDYDANSLQPTKVELISIDDNVKIPFIIQSASKLTKSSPYLSVLNDLARSKQRYNNIITSTGDVEVIGRNNFIGDGVSGRIIGSNNFVNSGSSFVFGDNNNVDTTTAYIIGSSNSVSSDVINGIVIGDGVVATQSNTLYTANIIIPEGGTINNQPINNVVGLWEAGSGIEAVQTPNNTASGDQSLSIGNLTTASGVFSVAQGDNSIASGVASHAEGTSTAQGDYSHAEGDGNTAVGYAAHVSGYSNYQTAYAETVVGHYSITLGGNSTTIVASDTAFRVGIGASSGTRKDGFRVYKNSAVKLNPVTSASITNSTAGMVIIDSSNNALSYYDGTTWLQYIEVATSTTGTVAQFVRPLTYNSPASPGTTNITDNLTGARIGIIQKMYHQNGTAPTFPAGWVLLRGVYSTTLLNIIYCEWVSGTRVEYWIIN